MTSFLIRLHLSVYLFFVRIFDPPPSNDDGQEYRACLDYRAPLSGPGDLQPPTGPLPARALLALRAAFLRLEHAADPATLRGHRPPPS